MKYLKDNGYTLLTFERWGDINKVNKPIFVTFDDGMKNNMNAFHVLQKLKDDTFKPAATEYMIVNNVDAEGSLSTSDIKKWWIPAFSLCNLILQHMRTCRRLQTMKKN